MRKRPSFINLLGKLYWDQDDRFKEMCTQLARVSTSTQRSSFNSREHYAVYQAPSSTLELTAWVSGQVENEIPRGITGMKLLLQKKSSQYQSMSNFLPEVHLQYIRIQVLLAADLKLNCTLEKRKRMRKQYTKVFSRNSTEGLHIYYLCIQHMFIECLLVPCIIVCTKQKQREI